MDEVDDRDVTVAVVEAFLERERGVRELLAGLEALALRGEHDAVRERVRAFAEADRQAFVTVSLALTGSEHFFGSVESRLGVEPADALREVARSHPALARPFTVVRTEVIEDRHNPVTGLDVTTSYDRESRVPMVGYTAHSGNLPLHETRESPAEVLGTASHLLQATNDALGAAVEGDHGINTDELSALIDRREELESELATLRDRIDEVRGAPTGEE